MELRAKGEADQRGNRSFRHHYPIVIVSTAAAAAATTDHHYHHFQWRSQGIAPSSGRHRKGDSCSVLDIPTD
jgi:hypothetical protein